MKQGREEKMRHVAIANLEYNDLKAEAEKRGFATTVTVSSIEKKLGLKKYQLTNYRRRKLERI